MQVLASALALLQLLAHQLVALAGSSSSNYSSHSALAGSAGRRQQVLQEDERAVLAAAAQHAMAAANSTAEALSAFTKGQPGLLVRLVSGSASQSETTPITLFKPVEAAGVLQVGGKNNKRYTVLLQAPGSSPLFRLLRVHVDPRKEQHFGTMHTTK